MHLPGKHKALGFTPINTHHTTHTPQHTHTHTHDFSDTGQLSQLPEWLVQVQSQPGLKKEFSANLGIY